MQLAGNIDGFVQSLTWHRPVVGAVDRLLAACYVVAAGVGLRLVPADFFSDHDWQSCRGLMSGFMTLPAASQLRAAWGGQPGEVNMS